MTDGFLAVMLYLATFVLPLRFDNLRWWAFPLAAVASLPMAWVRRRPLPIAGLVTIATGILTLTGVTNHLSVVWALFVLGWKQETRRAWVSIGITLAFMLGVLAASGYEDGENLWLSLIALPVFLVPALLGRMFNSSIQRNESIVRELSLRHELAAQAVRDTQQEERARLARELHDAVAHSMSVVAIHAAGAQAVLDSNPSAARDAMRTVELTARESLLEMRRLVSSLRVEYDEVAGFAPRSGFPEVVALIEADSQATLEIRGDRPSASALIDSSLFRIVQESLTNARRHAPLASAEVVIESSSDLVVIDVRNQMTAAPSSATNGFGIIGMAERVAAVGGVFRCGPDSWGRWEVHAELPVSRS